MSNSENLDLDVLDLEKLKLKALSEAETWVRDHKKGINSIQESIAKRRIIAPDPERRSLYNKRILRKIQTETTSMANEPLVAMRRVMNINPSELAGIPDSELERIIGKTNDIVSIEFLERGLQVAEAVGKITVADGFSFGTGFLVGYDLMMTSHHVLPDVNFAKVSRFDLNNEENQYGNPKRIIRCVFDPDRFFYTNKENDFTLVAVKTNAGNLEALHKLTVIPLLSNQGKIQVSHPVNIIQHPNGRVKSIAMHNSWLMQMENKNEDPDQFCVYSCDTEPGSSGSPVFNNRWEMIALHRKGVPDRNDEGKLLDRMGEVLEGTVEENENKINWIYNQGVRTSRIVNAFKAAELNDSFSRIREAVIADWNVLNF